MFWVACICSGKIVPQNDLQNIVPVPLLGISGKKWIVRRHFSCQHFDSLSVTWTFWKLLDIQKGWRGLTFINGSLYFRTHFLVRDREAMRHFARILSQQGSYPVKIGVGRFRIYRRGGPREMQHPESIDSRNAWYEYCHGGLPKHAWVWTVRSKEKMSSLTTQCSCLFMSN